MTTLLAHDASYEKLLVSMRYWLLGKGYHRALAAMEFGMKWHTGLRKDGTPEFSHQVWQAHFLRTIVPSLTDPEECFVVCFLHDVVEDYPVSLLEIEAIFGAATAASVGRMSKVIAGVKKDELAYFLELSRDPVASICKGVDRIHNQASMGEAFSPEKKLSYMDETETHILPMLKRARRTFTRQEPAFENIKHVLMSQITLIRSFHRAMTHA